MRHVALVSVVAVLAAVTLGAPAATAGCSQAPCVDAEPMWLPPATSRFALVSDTSAPEIGRFAAGATFAFRLHPAVLTVPAPSSGGRDVNLLRYAVDTALALRLGLGQRLELTVAMPAGLYQRGAGIKGITDQSAPALPAQSLHDPRLGFGYAFDTGSRLLEAKLRFEAKLPLGDADALSGETSPVASPSVVIRAAPPPHWHTYAGFELGLRLRRPVDFYGARVGSQGFVAVALGWDLPLGLSLTFEEYVLPSLVAAGNTRYLPAEWLTSARYMPARFHGFSLGLAGGGCFAFSRTPRGADCALGVPTFRGLLFVRYAPRGA